MHDGHNNHSHDHDHNHSHEHTHNGESHSHDHSHAHSHEHSHDTHSHDCDCGHDHGHSHNHDHNSSELHQNNDHDHTHSHDENCSCGHEHNHNHSHNRDHNHGYNHKYSHDEACDCGHDHSHEHSHDHQHDAELRDLESIAAGTIAVAVHEHEGAIVASGALIINTSHPQEFRHEVADEVERIAAEIGRGGGIVGHVKASFVATSFDMLSVTEAGAQVTLKRAPELEIKIGLTAIAFHLTDKAMESLVRQSLENLL